MSRASEADPTRSAEPAAELMWDDIPRLMEDLQDMAARLLRRWPGMGSLQPTLLVNTALRRQRHQDQSWDAVGWENRNEFFGQVFRAMRHKLVEHRRHQKTRGYRAQRRVSVAELELFEAWRQWPADTDLALALEAGLESLSASDPELVKLVEYRFFSGLTWEEAAAMLDCSLATVKRRWQKARLILEESIRKHLELPPLA